MLSLFLQTSLIILSLVTLLWVWSVFIKNVSIIDIFWGLGYVIVNSLYFFSSEVYNQRKIVLLILVALWGLRLTVYLGWRNYGKQEDYRYQEFRKKYGPERYWWFSYFQVFLLQGTLIMIISLPFLGIHGDNNVNALNLLDYIAIVFWLIGFLFETIGDYQLAKFKSNPNNKGNVLNSGLWRYTRHPNYFGDATVWFAYALFSIAAGSYWFIIGPIIMVFLIIKVSGVALLEDTLKDTKPKYKEYIQKTNSFFPWFPKD